MIASREELPFPSARLHSRQLMIRLDTSDLRFTNREGEQFYRSCMALALPEQAAHEWVEKTEGWITTMKLAALSHRAEDDPSMLLRKFSGASHLIDQYLMEEVFVRQSEPIRHLLMDCSILKRMNAQLCRALTGFDDCQEQLEQLERARLFIVPLDNRKGWYRFHHLFAEFLYNRMLRTKPDRLPVLLEAAGEHCEAEGLLEEGLEYYLTGKLYKRAIGLLEEMTSQMVRMNTTVWLRSQLARIPEPTLLQHPFLYFSYIHLLLLHEEQAASVDRLLSYAEKHYEAAAREWTEESKNDFWASYYFNKMLYAALVLGDQHQVIHNMMLSKRYRPHGPRLIFARQSRFAGKPSIFKEHSGQLVNRPFLVSFLNQMIDTFEEAGLADSSLVCLAEGYYEYNEMDEAEQTIKRAIQSADVNNPMLLEMLFPSRLVLSRIQQARGLYDEAKETLRSARRELIDLGLATTLIYCDAERAWLDLCEGDASAVAEWMRMYRLTENDPVTASRLYEYQSLLRFLMFQERYEQAEELANKLAAFGRDPATGGESAELSLLLTPKETEILRLIAQRLTNKEISARLQIGYGTVRSHINNIYSKLEVRTRPEAIHKGESMGL
ncbi:helix-turn-helix transcriptional regulator [Cohnella fermenti]|uniref:helix-turn-helix transcriptional regulator n=1 Tax=Cohnella fermenti TaxID=2565925 RepID=UPI001454B999|nr:LuxR C-terminal-related transcriptional regulator [Cohnella fermenti]